MANLIVMFSKFFFIIVMAKLIVMFSKFFFIIVMAKLIVMFFKFVSSSSSWLKSLLCLVSLFLHHRHG